MYKLRLMAKSLTLVKIVDRVLYRTDGVTQIPLWERPFLGWILVGSVVMNCMPFYDNLVVPSQKNLFRRAKSVAKFQDRRLA